MKNTRDKKTIIFVSILVVIVLGVYATLVVYHSIYFTQQYEGYFEFINENDLQVSCEIDQAFTSSKDFAIRPLREKINQTRFKSIPILRKTTISSSSSLVSLNFSKREENNEKIFKITLENFENKEISMDFVSMNEKENNYFSDDIKMSFMNEELINFDKLLSYKIKPNSSMQLFLCVDNKGIAKNINAKLLQEFDIKIIIKK